MPAVRVVPVTEPALGFPAPVHFIVTEPGGKAIVIELPGAAPKIFDAPLGVITNAPTYDWHEINLRNYVNLSPVGIPGKKIDELDFRPLGGGSGMIGLPGDFTPPSRFVRRPPLLQDGPAHRRRRRTSTRSSASSTTSTCRSGPPRRGAIDKTRGWQFHALDDRPRYEGPRPVLPHAAQPSRPQGRSLPDRLRRPRRHRPPAPRPRERRTSRT